MVAVGCAGYAAWEAAERFVVVTYKSETQVLYNQNNSGFPDYESPSLLTLIPIVESRNVFERALQNLQIDASPTDLEESLEIEVPYESNLLLMSFKWQDEAEGIQILDQLLSAFMAEVSQARSTAVQKIFAQYESSLSQYDSRLSEARKALQDFNDQVNVIDLERDLGNVQLDLQLIEATLATAQRRRAGQEAQLDALATTKADGKDKPAGVSTSALDLERWRVLRDFISTEQQEIQLKTQIEFKQREYDRALRLHEQKYISDAELDQVAVQLQTLRSAYDPSLQPLRSQLDSIQSRVPGALAGNRTSSPLLPSSASPSLQIELALLESQADAQHLGTLIEDKRTRLAELLEVRQEAQMLQDNVVLLNGERDRIRQRLADLRGLLDPEPTEFAVMQAPAPALKSVSDNRNKLLVGAFCGCLVILLGPVLLWDTVANRKQSHSAPQRDRRDSQRDEASEGNMSS